MRSLDKLSQGRWTQGPLVLAIMDGIGVAPHADSNAVTLSKTPVLDSLRQDHPWTLLRAHGTAVGMPSDEDMGNSEVGHNALGAGRVVSQGAKLVDEAIISGNLFKSQAWKEALAACKGGTLHFIGLVSDGNVHSHIRHLDAMLEACHKSAVPKVRVHALLDGRDVGARSALDYITPLESRLKMMGDYAIASGGGRMLVTMDRYQADWAMVERGWKTHVLGQAPCFASATEAITAFRKTHPDLTDQYIEPFVVGSKSGGPLIAPGDSVILFNFRGDRAIEVSMAFEGRAPFHTEVQGIHFAGMMSYDGDLHIPRRYLVDPPKIEGCLSQWLAASGVRSFACSETQKFGHVTYFWNGNRSTLFDERLERYVEIPSDNIPFDQKPQMKAAEITDKVIEELGRGWDFMRLNYANGDMVGHTGNLEATIKAVEAVDFNLGRLWQAVQNVHGTLLVTADHGNADVMFKVENGVRQVVTSHTLNPVPFIMASTHPGLRVNQMDHPGLGNVTATVCALLGYKAPENYLEGLASF